MTFIPRSVGVAWGLVLLTGWAATYVLALYTTVKARRWGWLVLCASPSRACPQAWRTRGSARTEIEDEVLGGAPPERPVPDLPGTAPDERQAPARRKQARAVIIFAVIVVALFLILPRLAGQKHALDMLREASVPLLILGGGRGDGVAHVLLAALPAPPRSAAPSR